MFYRKTFKILIGVLGLLLCLSAAAWSQTIVTMQCPGATFSPNNVVIHQGDSVRFLLGSTCAIVAVSGNGPIGGFVLGFINPSQTITFPNLGTFTAFSSSGGDNSSMTVTVLPTGPIPSLTTYGLIILALLLMSTAIWLFRKRPAVERGGVA